MGENKTNWRDVDVRLMLSVKHWASLGLMKPEDCHRDPKWRALCIVFSHYGRHLTGLPVDFQIQRNPEANKEYGGKGRSYCGTINAKRSADYADPLDDFVEHQAHCELIAAPEIYGSRCTCIGRAT
jgi:hypothetical protein